jgi:hypothetical protein
MKCKVCGCNLSKTDRKCRVTEEDKISFIKRNMFLFKDGSVSPTTVWLARKELDYSPKTVRSDIAIGLRKTYCKLTGKERE